MVGIKVGRCDDVIEQDDCNECTDEAEGVAIVTMDEEETVT